MKRICRKKMGSQNWGIWGNILNEGVYEQKGESTWGSVDTDVSFHLHISACPFSFFRNALRQPELWAFPSFLVSLTVQSPPSTHRFPDKTNQHLLLPAMADSFWTMPICSGLHRTDIVVTVPSVSSHVPHAFCVLFKSIWTTGCVRAELQPMLLSPCQQPF